MANQAFSRSDDLMVGAGELYFQRSDDPNGWHHLGNAEEFTINNNIETIEKNSSMNKKRELMASVTTSVQPTASITLNEYNPYDMALGLYGTEGVLSQVGRTLTAEAYTVPSVPGIITIIDPDGNRCMDISDVVVAPSTTVPVGFTFTSTLGTMSGTVLGSVFTDTNGGTITLNPATASPTADTTVYITISNAPTTAGDLDGLAVTVMEGAAGTPQTFNVTSTATTQTFTLASGATMTFDVATATAVVPFTFSGLTPITGAQALLTPALTTYTEGRDYTVDAQGLRAGIIKIKNGGSISAGDTVLISCTVPQKDYVTVSGANAGEIEGKLLFIGDPNIGGQYNIEGWKVKVTPDGDFTGLIGDDFGTYTLTVRFLTDYENHPDYPYYRATMINRASGGDKVSGTYDPEY